jgi:serine/threonine protein kinase
MTDVDDDTSVQRPHVFGDYTLLTTLARGGMGSIHLAKRVGFRPDIQRFFVVKKLRRKHANARERRRFEDEARVVVTLNHRALCHVFDVGVVADEHYLAMELVEGVNLFQLLRAMGGGKLDARLALYIVDEVLDALDYAHRHKDPATGLALQIVHRDVSPHNVMLSFQGAVKLIDFGLVSSTLKQEQTVGGVVVGKVEYMSPEQARGEPLDARSDVYATAVILFELLSGRRFYEGMSKGALMTALVDGNHVPSFDGIDAPLAAVLRRALAGERDARTSSCADLQAELAAVAPRASSRELRDALQRALPDEHARLEELMRSFRDVVIEAPPDNENTRVTHIARSGERSDEQTQTRTADVSDQPTRIVPTPRATPVGQASAPAPSVPLALALVVALVSGAAVIGVWLLAREKPLEPVAVTLTTAPPPTPIIAEPDAGALVVDETIEEEEEAAAPTATKKRVKRSKPPLTPLPDLAAHMDYLARWCSRTSCAGRVLASRGKIPLLDVVGLRALRRDAEACVVECRR